MIMVMIILPICMLVIGSLYFYDCPAGTSIYNIIDFLD